MARRTSKAAKATRAHATCVADVPVNRRCILADGRAVRRIDDLNSTVFVHVDGERNPTPIAADTPVVEILPVELEARDTAPVVDPLMRSA